jgi:methylenetetrahydrofolate dehydrogenase (NADP+)/methenyltetrahydrofolate cyclohydrolase
MHILATFRKKTIVFAVNMHIKTTSKRILVKLSCIIYAIDSYPLWRCAVALVLDGRALATQIEADLLVRVEALKAKTGRTPILATILVGDDGASATYVRMKGNACRRVGMDSLKVELPKETTTEQLLAEIEKLNANPDVHGILLQHPVPEQIDERACFDELPNFADRARTLKSV